MEKEKMLNNFRRLIEAYKKGELGQTVMPEDSHPIFKNQEERLIYFTLPMALNYQRNSYALWEAALKTWEDKEAKCVFDIEWVSKSSDEELREKLLKHKLALQPNKHIKTWKNISATIFENWGSFSNLFKNNENSFLKLKETIQDKYKKGFPYLSGPKIFNYWAFIISTYGKIDLKERNFIDIAPDTHITKCSIKLGVISEGQGEKLSKEEISKIWRDLLDGSEIDPIDMHAPLWFWSRNGFLFDFEK